MSENAVAVSCSSPVSVAQSKAFIVNDGQWPQYSGFQALQPERREIRLLQQNTEADTHSMRYKMAHASLQRDPEYFAVSYCWGAPVPDGALKEIFLNGLSVRIRPTLYSFLETITIHYPGIRIWIDAICINQSDGAERNNQISIMGDIFKGAKCVLVWLGSGDDDTNYAMDHIGNYQPQTNCLLDATMGYPGIAMAQEIKVACGVYSTGWGDFTNKINEEVLMDHPSLRQTLERFKSLRSPGPRRRMTLLELMDVFQDARCTDPRDRAFALRGLAADGGLLSPNYGDSVGDLYFRLLSMLPTERVLPVMCGYRWPHQAAHRLSKYMRIMKQDIFSSLTSTSTDRLFAVFEYIASIAKVSGACHCTTEDPLGDHFPSFPLQVQLGNYSKTILRGSIGLLPGDTVYCLRSTSESPKGFFMAFRPSAAGQAVMGVMIEWPERNKESRPWKNIDYPYADPLPDEKLRDKRFEFIKGVILGGVSKCSRNDPDLRRKARVLCHINRVTLILLWLLDAQQLDYLWNIREEIQTWSVGKRTLCSCAGDEEGTLGRVLETGGHQNSTVEILPSYQFHLDKFSAEEMTTPWNDQVQHGRQEQLHDEGFAAESKDIRFNWPETTTLIYAAEDGLARFVKILLDAGANIDAHHKYGNTALIRASLYGHDKVVEILLSAGANVNAQDEIGNTALIWASISGQNKVVEILLSAGANVNAHHKYGNTALIQASHYGYGKVVEILLSAGANVKGALEAASDPSCYADDNHYAVVKMLLGVGGCPFTQKELDEALLKVSKNGRVETVQLLLEARANVNAEYESSTLQDAIVQASARGHGSVVKILQDALARQDHGS
ncbi:Ankyrin repeat-containing protein [Cladophialophora immunda]|nr:Ankyrin repeat-containing protein [Cladophialophora immunda]